MIIGSKSCRTCEHRHVIPTGEMFCWRFPPQVCPVPMAGPEGKPFIGFQPVFPAVNADVYCGEYKRSEQFAAEEMQAAKESVSGMMRQ